MKNHSDDPSERWDTWREEIIGLGSRSYKKNYYQVLKKKIEELHLSEKKFHTFFDFVNDAIFIHSLEDGKILDVNRKALDIFGFSRKEILDKTIEELSEGSPPFSQKEAVGWIHTVIKEGPQVFEWRSRDAFDRLFWVEVNMAETAIGEERVVIVSARDIDRRKRNELELIEYRKNLEDLVEKRTQEISSANQKLEETLTELKDTQSQVIQIEKMASLGVLTAGIAHEINNPINFISTAVPGLEQDFSLLFSTLELLRREQPLTNEQQEVIDKNLVEIDQVDIPGEVENLLLGIKEGVSRSSDIIQSLKSYSRLENHFMEEDSLIDNIELAIKLLRNRISSDIHINRDFRFSGNIICYPGHLNQAFINLIANAIESVQEVLSERTGIIYIRTSKVVINGVDSVRIEVIDNGTGIPEESLQKIFDPFYSRKKQGGGTGLGLSVCQKIVNEHKGTLTVENMDQGCRFKITIPIREEL